MVNYGQWKPLRGRVWHLQHKSNLRRRIRVEPSPPTTMVESNTFNVCGHDPLLMIFYVFRNLRISHTMRMRETNKLHVPHLCYCFPKINMGFWCKVVTHRKPNIPWARFRRRTWRERLTLQTEVACFRHHRRGGRGAPIVHKTIWVRQLPHLVQ